MTSTDSQQLFSDQSQHQSLSSTLNPFHCSFKVIFMQMPKGWMSSSLLWCITVQEYLQYGDPTRHRQERSGDRGIFNSAHPCFCHNRRRSRTNERRALCLVCDMPQKNTQLCQRKWSRWQVFVRLLQWDKRIEALLRPALQFSSAGWV